MDTVTVDPDDVRAVATMFSYLRQAAGPMVSYVPGIDDAAAACSRLMQAVAGVAMPLDPISSVAAAAISVHEVMTAYMDAGFERDEAFDLTKVHVNASATASAFRSGNG